MGFAASDRISTPINCYSNFYTQQIGIVLNSYYLSQVPRPSRRVLGSSNKEGMDMLSYFKHSNQILSCKKLAVGLLYCSIFTDHGSFHSRNILRISDNLIFASPNSPGPNRIDIWYSGGIAAKHKLSASGNTGHMSVGHWRLQKNITIIRCAPIYV